MHRVALIIVSSWLAACASPLAAEEPAPKNAQERPSQKKIERREQLEAGFRKTLTGATLVGKYTQDDQDGDQLPANERYTIHKVAKVSGKEGYWQFYVRLQFGDINVVLPLQLKVRWAGDTPVVTLTDYAIPGLGTFSARVLFYGDRYAGTWQHGKVGGHLFGDIVVEDAREDPVEDE